MITRRTALKTAAVAAAATHPTLRGAADAAPDPEPASALRRNRLPYGPEHPLAQGEKLTVSDPHVQVEEVS
ncbi:MAG: hypothetical protein KC442_12355, partial [Thermomicrobiales bacterium]|nr:hypothetical protein [Thermomicrobiales bacterium]